MSPPAATGPPTFSKLVWADAVRRCTDIPATQRLVILHIGATADPDGRDAWRANDLVAEELGVSRDTVKRARAEAVRFGLWVVSRPAPRGAGNTKTAEYQLLSPPVDNTANGGPGAPIKAGEMSATVHPIRVEMGAVVLGNRCKTTSEMGAGEGHPSVLPSGSSSGGALRHPLPCPDHPDGNSTKPCQSCKAVRERELALRATTRAAIDNCGDCDQYGRDLIDPNVDCPKHGNFRNPRPAVAS